VRTCGASWYSELVMDTTADNTATRSPPAVGAPAARAVATESVDLTKSVTRAWRALSPSDQQLLEVFAYVVGTPRTALAPQDVEAPAVAGWKAFIGGPLDANRYVHLNGFAAAIEQARALAAEVEPLPRITPDQADLLLRHHKAVDAIRPKYLHHRVNAHAELAGYAPLMPLNPDPVRHARVQWWIHRRDLGPALQAARLGEAQVQFVATKKHQQQVNAATGVVAANGGALHPDDRRVLIDWVATRRLGAIRSDALWVMGPRIYQMLWKGALERAHNDPTVEASWEGLHANLRVRSSCLVADAVMPPDLMPESSLGSVVRHHADFARGLAYPPPRDWATIARAEAPLLGGVGTASPYAPLCRLLMERMEPVILDGPLAAQVAACAAPVRHLQALVADIAEQVAETTGQLAPTMDAVADAVVLLERAATDVTPQAVIDLIIGCGSDRGQSASRHP